MQRTTEQRGEVRTDGQAEAGADRALDLLELAEHAYLVFRRNAGASVEHAQLHIRRLDVALEADASRLRELHGIAEQVDQDLSQSPPVGDQRQVATRRLSQLETLLLRLRTYAEQRIIEHTLQVRRLQIDLHTVGLQLRKVQQVVQQAEQVFCGTRGVLDEAARALGQLAREPLEHQLAVSLDRTDRCAQVVRHGIIELLLRARGLAQLRVRLGQLGGSLLHTFVQAGIADRDRSVCRDADAETDVARGHLVRSP